MKQVKVGVETASAGSIPRRPQILAHVFVPNKYSRRGMFDEVRS